MKGIENYIILNINNAGKKELKKGLIYTTALTIINPKQEYKYNRVLMLIALYEKLNYDFLPDEILHSLEELILLFPEFIVPHFHLGEYYLDKDMDVAKVHLRKCIEEPELYEEATELLRKIENTESFDEAVEFIKKEEVTRHLIFYYPFVRRMMKTLMPSILLQLLLGKLRTIIVPWLT